MENVLYAVGAYGRVASEKDWVDGRDFRVLNTQVYFSKRDLRRLRDDGYVQIVFMSLGEEVFTRSC